MADGRNQSRKGHYKCAGTYRRFRLHAEKRCEYHQHHHTAAGAHKARAEADGQTEKEGDGDALSVQLLPLCGSIVPAGVRLDQKADADEKGQKKSESAQHHIPHDKSHVAADRTHAQNADKHDPAALQIDVFMPGICIGRHGGAKDVRCKCDGGRLIRTCLAGKRWAENDQNRDHDCGGGKPREARADARTQRRDNVPKPLQLDHLRKQYRFHQKIGSVFIVLRNNEFFNSQNALLPAVCKVFILEVQ